MESDERYYDDFVRDSPNLVLKFCQCTDIYDEQKKKFIGVNAVDAEWMPSNIELKKICDYRNRVIGMANCQIHEWDHKIPGEMEDVESEVSDTSAYDSDLDDL